MPGPNPVNINLMTSITMIRIVKEVMVTTMMTKRTTTMTTTTLMITTTMMTMTMTTTMMMMNDDDDIDGDDKEYGVLFQYHKDPQVITT